MARSSSCQVVNLGMVDYIKAWQLQKKLVERVHDHQGPNTLLLVEHPAVYTMGRMGRKDQVLIDEKQFAELGAPLHEVDRGGRITFHGPGQLVTYPILNLRDWGGPLKYVRTLEQVMISSLADFGISGSTIEGLTGVWVNEAKIGAIGVKISRGVSFHGSALNVSTDLSWYDHIVPCGITDRGMTSMSKVLGHSVDPELVSYSMVYHLGDLMGLRMFETGELPELLTSEDMAPLA